MSTTSRDGEVGQGLGSRVLRHLRGNVIGYLALVLALGMTPAWAEQQLDKNSVRSQHIKNGQVKAKDLRKKAVRSKHIKDGTIKRADIGKNAVGSGQLADGSVRPGHIADGTVGPDHLAPVTRVLNLPAAAFQQTDPYADARLTFYPDGGFVYLNGTTSPRVAIAVAPVLLPPGAVVSKVRCRVRDTHGSANIDGEAVLQKRKHTAGGLHPTAGSFEMAQMRLFVLNDSQLVPFEFADDTIAEPVVVADADYWLEVLLNTGPAESAMGFHGCSLHYTH